MDKRTRQRLTHAEKKPLTAFERGWVQDPAFCAALLDRCEDFAFVGSAEALKLARRAVELTETHGDPHLIHRSYGVLANAYYETFDRFWAGKTLEMVKERALVCCPRCRSEHLRRVGDLLGEMRQADASLAALDHALEEGGRHISLDAAGRIAFVRGIAHHIKGNRRRALRDMGIALRDVSLDAPRGYFMDSSSVIAFAVGGGDPGHDEAGSALLDAFGERIKGLRGWHEARTRWLWARGQLRARQGEFSRARRDLDSTLRRHLATGLPREAVAAALDVAQLMCRHEEPRGGAAGSAGWILERCLTQRATDLPAALREGLVAMQGVLEQHPQNAFEELVRFRRSFVAPVPGVMAERIGAR